MSRRHLRRKGPGPLELIEEAVHLLRVVPGAALGCYYFGSLPFVLGLLYFWADMSRGATAYEHGVPAAFAVALLFLWMKTWQAIFVRHLKAQIAGRSAVALTLPGFFRTAMNQTILQPSGLFLLPLALLIVFPFGWFYAFYQSVTAFGTEDGVAAKDVFRRAAQQAQLWPKQNHLLLGALLVFGLVVFLDVAIGLATIPALLKMLFGIETVFTRSPSAILNTTFMATAGALSYLCLDPLVKAVYLLRCFYGESLHTGEDLRAELRQVVPGARAAALVLFLVLLALEATAGPRGEAINCALAFTPGKKERGGVRRAHLDTLTGARLCEPLPIESDRRAELVKTLGGTQRCCRSQTRALLECAGRAQRRRRFGSNPNGDGTTELRGRMAMQPASSGAPPPNPKRRGATLPAALQNACSDEMAERCSVSHTTSEFSRRSRPIRTLLAGKMPASTLNLHPMAERSLVNSRGVGPLLGPTKLFREFPHPTSELRPRRFPLPTWTVPLSRSSAGANSTGVCRAKNRRTTTARRASSLPSWMVWSKPCEVGPRQ